MSQLCGGQGEREREGMCVCGGVGGSEIGTCISEDFPLSEIAEDDGYITDKEPEGGPDAVHPISLYYRKLSPEEIEPQGRKTTGPSHMVS